METLLAAKPSETFELHEVPHCWGRAINRTVGCVAIVLGAALAILGVVVAFDIGFGLARTVCIPTFLGGSPIGVLRVVAPIADSPLYCPRPPYHDLGLLVMGFGVILLLVGLLLIAVGGSAVFWVEP